MDINDISFGQAKEIAEAFSGSRPARAPFATLGLVQGDRAKDGANATATPSAKGPIASLVGQKVIIRTYSAGVHFGTLAEKDGHEVILTDARRLWYWKAAKSISLSAVAVHGIDEKSSKIAPPVPAIWLEAIEIIPASAEAITSIEGAPHVEAA